MARLLIDALNVAYWCGAPPSLRLPLTLLQRLLRDGHEAALIFDASASHQLKAEGECYTALLQHPGYCIEVPKGRPADQLLLRQARASGGCIVSRDHYRDHRRRFRKLIDDPTRLLPGWVKDDVLVVPALHLEVSLAASAALAWLYLQAQIASMPRQSS